MANQSLNSALTGLLNGLNTYLGIGTELHLRNQLNEKEMEQKKNLYLWQKSVDAAMERPKSTIKYKNLKKLNPRLEALGLDDEAEIPTADLSDFASLMPKEDGSSVNPYMSLPEAASHLYMLGVDDNKIGEITAKFRKNGGKGVLKSVLDEAAKAYGASPTNTESRLRIFANSSGMDVTDENFLPSFRKWSDSIDSYKKSKEGAQIRLPMEGISGAASLATQMFEKNVKQGMSQSDALDAVTTELSKAYDSSTVDSILSKVDMDITPRPKTPHPGFKSLLMRVMGVNQNQQQ